MWDKKNLVLLSMNFFKNIFHRLESAVWGLDYSINGPRFLVLPPTHQEAIRIFVDAGMSNKEAFKALDKIITELDPFVFELPEIAEQVANEYIESNLSRIAW